MVFTFFLLKIYLKIAAHGHFQDIHISIVLPSKAKRKHCGIVVQKKYIGCHIKFCVCISK